MFNWNIYKLYKQNSCDDFIFHEHLEAFFEDPEFFAATFLGDPTFNEERKQCARPAGSG